MYCFLAFGLDYASIDITGNCYFCPKGFLYWN